ncbi:CBS domain-containing protein [Halorientalis pallida]|uniref:CBS domain-containing protein n=1 Tax=Halorientalis pallida TaxID=2479928 RepID=A0A498KSX5_9EURY|nr:CBS domain-containing protein [Halorientalis pallida]RXK47030.1 CBS domain-containing protein [Halorientalis pallida]
MDDIFVARLMSSGTISISPDTLVEEAADILLEKEIGSLVVVDSHNQLKGILTSTDFVRIVAKSQPKANMTVERYMTDQVVTVDAQDSIRDAADKMITYGIQHLPVVDDEEGVIGMLSTTDLTAYLSDVEQSSVA